MLIARKRRGLGRRGVSAVEAAVVYPITILLLLGTVVLGLGVFRYQQLQCLAREGARYASVHGPQYATDSGNAYATNQTVLTQIETLAVGLDLTQLELHRHMEPHPADHNDTLDGLGSAHLRLGARRVFPSRSR